MEFKRLTAETLEEEHICCAISNTKKDVGVASKKAWLKARMEEGLVFEKLDIRGKVFIEYLPAEMAWEPIEADGFMFINCLWVSGQYHGQGYAGQLLQRCIADSKEKGKKGLVIISSKKKQPFLSEPGFLKHHGFLLADETDPYFELLYLPFDASAAVPKFRTCVHQPVREEGWVLYYTHQCPHTAKYVPILVEALKAKGIDLRIVLLDTKEKAQAAPIPHTTYALLYQGQFITNEILTEKSFFKYKEKHNIS